MGADATEAARRLRAWFARMALAAAALTFVVVLASAFMRHTQAGLACADWPACYGRIEVTGADAVVSTGVRAARIAHRLAATGVLALVIGLLLVAWTQRPAWKRAGSLALAALVLAAALALLGLATPGSRLPAVTVGNLLGGHLMLALLAAVVAAAPRDSPDLAVPAAGGQTLACVALAAVYAQAATGAMIGAQFALTACPALFGCGDISPGGLAASGALDPFRTLSVVDARVAPPGGAAGLHVVHRTLGLAVVAATLALAWRLRGRDPRGAGLLAALVVAAALLGAAAIALMPSLPATVLHNAAAASLAALLAYRVARG